MWAPVLNCYESKEANPKPVDYAELGRGEQEIIANEEVAPNQSRVSEVVVFEGTFVCVKHCRQLRMQLSSSIWPDLTRICMLQRKLKQKLPILHKTLYFPFNL